MANHSLIKLPRSVRPEDVELALADINVRRFAGRLALSTTPYLTARWDAARAWLLTAPGTRPKVPGPFDPDEDLGFCFWLHRDGKAIETRHAVHNGWMRWVMHIHEHELARHFGVAAFDGGDGEVPTDTEQFKSSYDEWVARHFEKPLSLDDAAYLKRLAGEAPEGWPAPGATPPTIRVDFNARTVDDLVRLDTRCSIASLASASVPIEEGSLVWLSDGEVRVSAQVCRSRGELVARAMWETREDLDDAPG